MTRLIFILSFWLLLFLNAVGQNSKSSVLVEKFHLKLLLIKEKLVTDSLIKIYGDISEAEISKIIDTTFVKSLIQSNSHDHDQLICTAYKIPYIIGPIGWISDYGHIFTDGQISQLDSILSDYEMRTSNEIAVVTFDSSFVHDENFDSLVLDIHNFWGIGKMHKNNGILIGISTAKRKIRISNGSGIVDKLSDKETKAIIDDIIIPAFKKGDYFEGLLNAIEEIIKKV